MFVGGFTHKTIKESLFIKVNQVYPQRNRRGKTLKDSRRQTTEAEGRWLPCGAGYDMRRSKLLFILFQVTLKFWRFIFWKTQKFYMMSSYMTKLEFPLEPHMLFRLGKLPHICCLFLHWVLSSFVDPYERFVMILKSKSHTHHIYLLLLHWEYAKTCFPSRFTQKCFTPTLGVNIKKHAW